MKNVSRKIWGLFMVIFVVIIALPITASAHCDTLDGPVVTDARKAIEKNNINYILKWVTPEGEQELSQVFELAVKVRGLSAESAELADRYLFDNLVRIHRAGEGVPFTGVKPSGTPVDEKIEAADRSIETGNISLLEKMVPHDEVPELEERFEKVMALKNFDINNVEAGREYVEAYVSFFHFAEGEEEGDAHAEEKEESHVKNEGNAPEHEKESSESFQITPWVLAGIFFITTIISSVGYFIKSSNSK